MLELKNELLQIERFVDGTEKQNRSNSQSPRLKKSQFAIQAELSLQQKIALKQLTKAIKTQCSDFQIETEKRISALNRKLSNLVFVVQTFKYENMSTGTIGEVKLKEKVSQYNDLQKSYISAVQQNQALQIRLDNVHTEQDIRLSKLNEQIANREMELM